MQLTADELFSVFASSPVTLVPEVLQQRVAALEQERAEFIRLKQQLEAEFNQKRAKFKDLYMSKEGWYPKIINFINHM